VSDQDSKSRTIANPDAVKGHERHHVALTAHVDADKNEVHAVSLKMAKRPREERQHAEVIGRSAVLEFFQKGAKSSPVFTSAAQP
jgi:hypothetical protein